MIIRKKTELRNNFGNYESGTFGGEIEVDSSEFPDLTPQEISHWMQDFIDGMIAADLRKAEDVSGLDINASFIAHWNSHPNPPTEKDD